MAEFSNYMSPGRKAYLIGIGGVSMSSLAEVLKGMGITATELYNRLKRHGLVRRLLLDCYDTLHTESIDGVVWNVQEALRNWDEKEGGRQR